MTRATGAGFILGQSPLVSPLGHTLRVHSPFQSPLSPLSHVEKEGWRRAHQFCSIAESSKAEWALVSKLKQANVDVVYFGGLHTEAGLIIRQMRDQGLNAPLMGGDGIVSSEFTAIAGPGAEGTLMTFGPDARKNPNAKEVVEKFRKKGYEPETYTLYTYLRADHFEDGGSHQGTGKWVLVERDLG